MFEQETHNLTNVNACSFGGGSGPDGVAFDEANIWVTNGGSGTVSKRQA